MHPEASKIPLDKLYQEVILDHNRKPRNFGILEDATVESHGYNPLCGDDYHLYLKTNSSGQIVDVKFQGQGCAISKSSASIMTTKVKGKTIEEAVELKNTFVDLVTKDNPSENPKEVIGNLSIFEGVRQFPIRVKCATLAWHTLEDAVKKINS